MAIKDWSITAADNDDADASINWLENQSPSTVNNSARAMMAALKVWYNDQGGGLVYVGTVGGTADVITLTPTTAITAYAAGQSFAWIASGANTTNVTVNVSGVGAVALTKNGSTALVAGDITSGSLVVARHDGTRFQLQNVSSSGSGSVVTTSGTQTLTNKTISLGSNTISGTTAQFNTALSDGDFATLAGTETLTNKTINNPAINGTVTGSPTPSGLWTFQQSGNTTVRSFGGTGYGAFYANGASGQNAYVFFAENEVERARIFVSTGSDELLFATGSGADIRARVGSGLRLGAPTGGDLGAGTINVATSYSVNNVLVPTISSTSTLTNKTINLSSNTLTGTTAQFNTALSDGDFATLAGTETLTNKTLTSPALTTPTVDGYSVGDVLLTSGSASGAATLDIVMTSYTSYPNKRLVLYNLIPTTDNVNLYMQVSTNGGSSYDSGAGNYSYVSFGYDEAGTLQSSASASATQIVISNAGIGSATSEGMEITIDLLNTTSTTRHPKFNFHGGFISGAATPALTSFAGTGCREAAQDTDALRFLMSGGNITCSYKLYGLN